MRKSPSFSLLLGDLNIWLGAFQENLTHQDVVSLPPRESKHIPPTPPDYLASIFTDIIDQNRLIILNGRFGTASADTTFEDHSGLETTLDYAICHQGSFTRVLNVRVHRDNVAGVATDHRPLQVNIQTDCKAPDDVHGESEGWWEEEHRSYLNVSPFSLPADDPQRIQLTSNYQEALQRGLQFHLQQLQELHSTWDDCRTRRSRAGSAAPRSCPMNCPCQNMERHVTTVSADISATIAATAATLLEPNTAPRKHKKRSLIWQPDKEWRTLRNHKEDTWKHLTSVPQSSPAHAHAKATHKQACFQLLKHTSLQRQQWLSNRLRKLDLRGPAHDARANWARIKSAVGEDRLHGLPRTILTHEGTYLQGDAATNHWHIARARIGQYDALAPEFDPQAHRVRLSALNQDDRREREHAHSSAPSDQGTDPMNDIIGPHEIRAMLQKASRSTSPGTEPIQNELLIHGGQAIIDTLLLLYNLVWKAGVTPDAWRKALIRPIYKAASREPLMVENWRAISLINVIAKGYEATLCHRITSHLERQKGIAPGQGARRNTGTEELVYTLISTIRARYAHDGSPTFAAFLDFRLAYPSTDHSVIFTKMQNKGISGRLWLAVRQLYHRPQSRVMHPGISQDCFFDLPHGIREGSILGPILFVVAVDDMPEYLAQHPFNPPAGLVPSHGRPPHRRTRAPGIWIKTVWLALLQFVDDAVLLASCALELQHMITVIARYCAINRLLLNAKPGKTEVIEFMSPPTGFGYKVLSPTKDDPLATAPVRVTTAYPYLGWLLDTWLTLDKHTARVAASIMSASSKVVSMGGYPGALPITTAFHLWSSLVLSYVHAAAALLSSLQIDTLQSKLDTSIRQLAGPRANPSAVLADLGLPTAHMIHELRLANLMDRLRTLPEYLTPASLHRLLMSNAVTSARGYEGQYLALLHKHTALHAWLPTPAPTSTLALDINNDGSITDTIRSERRRRALSWKRQIWERRRIALTTVPHPDLKLRRFTDIAADDLRRKYLFSAASYLQADLGQKSILALFQLRCQSTLLAADAGEDDDNDDTRCDGCATRLESLQQQLTLLRTLVPPPALAIQDLLPQIADLQAVLQNDPAEDAEHALFHCAKGMMPKNRRAWEGEMERIFSVYLPRTHASQIPLRWRDCPRPIQLRLALGSAPPAAWLFPQDGGKVSSRHLFSTEVQQTAARFALVLCKTLRDYHKAVLEDIESGRAISWPTVHGLWADPAWNLGVPFLGDSPSEDSDSDSSTSSN